jgi:sugar/nucleoside kinase (ribokinase family)
MKKVLFVGDINVDVMMGGMASLPMVDKEVLCDSYEVVMGSSTVICCCAYAALGGHASFMGLVGDDAHGEFMVDGMKGFGIDTELIKRTDKVKTGVTVNMIYRNTRTQVTYPGSIAEFDGEGLTPVVLSRFDHIHFGGVYPETNLKPRIAGFLRKARELGLTTSLDPQWDGTETWQYMDDWLPLLTYLCVNGDEAMSITRTTDTKGAERVLAQLTGCPLVKIGSEGVIAGGKIVPTRPVEVVDTTGAGDCFDAGFLFATLEKNADLYEAASFGNALAGRSCLYVGGTSHRSTYKDAIRFRAENPVTA